MIPYTAEEIRSRLGISTFVVYGKSLERESLERIARAGISHLEILDLRDQFQEEDPQTMKEIVSVCKQLGLSITSFHSRSVNYAQAGQAQRQKEVERSKRIIDHLISIGGRVWGTHVQIADQRTKESYHELATHYEQQNISLLIENFPDQPVAACIEWIDSISHPQIGMLLDVGHERDSQNQNLMNVPGEPTRIIRAIGPRLRHVHLHDFLDSDHYAPFEDGGQLQWAETFSALKEINYQGIFMFEPGPEEEFSKDPIGKVGQVPETISKLAN